LALRFSHRAAERWRLDGRHHYAIRCGQGGRHVAAVSRLPNQWPYTFILRLFHHGARVFAMAAMFASEHENKTPHTAIEHDARDLRDNELPIPRRDASKNEQDPRRGHNSPSVAQSRDPRGVDCGGIERCKVDAAWDDGEPLARNLMA